jgi:hypothetical protein
LKTVIPALLILLTSGALAQETKRLRPSITLQTGFASTFQLTLGGTFGAGPAWQNRANVDLSHVFTKNDALVFTGWMTRDTPSANRD